MERRDFILKLSRWGLALMLACLTLLLGKKIVLKKECSSCPDYASCPGVSSCEVIVSKE
ncbi:MAG: hypothetical protein QNK30_02250 [Bacteroidales bacterium]|nr:hypothetical protein [Bacteroidales bacterium]